MTDASAPSAKPAWQVVVGDIGTIASKDGPWLAVVSSDDNYLSHEGGSSASIWRAAGQEIHQLVATDASTPASLGQVVETRAGRLAAAKLIHAVTIDLDTGVRLDPGESTILFDHLARSILGIQRRQPTSSQRVLMPLVGTGAGRLSLTTSAHGLSLLIERLAPSGLTTVICCYDQDTADRLEHVLDRMTSRGSKAGSGYTSLDWSALHALCIRLLSTPPRIGSKSKGPTRSNRWIDFLDYELGGDSREDRDRRRAIEIALHERNLVAHGLREPSREAVERMCDGIMSIWPMAQGGDTSLTGSGADQLLRSFLEARREGETQTRSKSRSPEAINESSQGRSSEVASAPSSTPSIGTGGADRSGSEQHARRSVGGHEISEGEATSEPGRGTPETRSMASHAAVEPFTRVDPPPHSPQRDAHVAEHVERLVNLMIRLDGADLRDLADQLEAKGYRGDLIARVTEHCSREDPREVLRVLSRPRLRAVLTDLGVTMSATAGFEEIVERILAELGFMIPSEPRGLHKAIEELRVLRSQVRTRAAGQLADRVIRGSGLVMQCVRDLLRFVCLHLYGVGPEVHFKGRDGYTGRALTDCPDGAILSMLEWLARDLEAAEAQSLKELGGPLTSKRLAPEGTHGIVRIRNIFAHAKEQDLPSSPLSRRAEQFFDEAIKLLEWWRSGDGQVYPHIVRIDKIEIDLWNRRHIHAISDSGEAELIITSRPVRVGRLYFMFPVSNPWRIEPVLIEYGGPDG